MGLKRNCHWIIQKLMFIQEVVSNICLHACSLSWLPDNRCIPPVAKRAFGQDWGIVGNEARCVHIHDRRADHTPASPCASICLFLYL